jgi:hypothetical protein
MTTTHLSAWKNTAQIFFSYNCENYLSYIPLAEDLQMLQFQIFYRIFSWRQLNFWVIKQVGNITINLLTNHLGSPIHLRRNCKEMPTTQVCFYIPTIKGHERGIKLRIMQCTGTTAGRRRYFGIQILVLPLDKWQATDWKGLPQCEVWTEVT